MRIYENYKNISSSFWLSHIPQHWEYKKMKYIFSEHSEKGHPHEPLLVASQNMGVVPKDVYGNRTVEAQKDLHLLKFVNVGDFVISLRSFQGGIEYAYYQGIISPAYTILTPKDSADSSYLKYLLKSVDFISLLKLCVTGIREGQNIDYAKLKNYKLPVPPRTEQDQIVKFLDWKISCINKLIGIKKREIKCLRRAKVSNIKEIIDDLKCNFRLKNIAKSYGRIGFRGYSTVDLVEKGHGAITTSPSNISDMGMNFEQCSYLSWEKYEESPEIQLKKGDILVVKTGSSYGKTGFVDSLPLEATINPQLLIIRADSDNVIPEYLFYSIKYGAIQEQINKGIIGSTIPTISESRIMSYRLSIPEVGIQQKRLEKIKNLEFRYNKLIHTFEQSIMELNNLKVRVVSDVVTGKVDVRNIEIPEYEFVEEENDTVANSDNKEGPEE